MSHKHGFLVFLAVALLIAAGGLATHSANGTAPDTAAAVAPAPVALGDFAPATCDDPPAPQFEAGPDKVPPDCCATQCAVDRDCNKICGKGNCACVQVTSCCRRCVY